tara:strand:- start:5030 stop:5434 length:405 start_codon:yes stop_codon:yes gene_type:complete
MFASDLSKVATAILEPPTAHLDRCKKQYRLRIDRQLSSDRYHFDLNALIKKTEAWSYGQLHKKQLSQVLFTSLIAMLGLLKGRGGVGLFLLTKVMGSSVEEAQVFIASIRNGVKERRVHAHFGVVVFYVKKPER